MSGLEDSVRRLAIEAARSASTKDAEDIEVLDVSGVFVICDAFVLVSGRTDRQVKAIADEVERGVREATGRSPRAVEGRDTLRWVLVDYGDVVVHVFHSEDRGYYRLERLYGDVPRVDWDA
ncbi:MAG: ribosome silencing factor [Microthrixaceae bacterium]